jgi:hypothetical protein
MDNLKWWITLTPSQKYSFLMALIIVALGYTLKYQDEQWRSQVIQIIKERNNAIVSKDSALNVARVTEIECLKRENDMKETLLQEEKNRTARSEAINEDYKRQISVNDTYANKLIRTLNSQKKITNAQ